MTGLVLILAGVALGVAGVLAPDDATARDVVAGVLLVGVGLDYLVVGLILRRRRRSDRRRGYVHR